MRIIFAERNIFAKKPVKSRGDRYRKEYSAYSADTRTEGNCNKHKKRGESHRFSNNPGVDKIFLNLLEHKEENEKKKRFKGRNGKNHNSAHTCADKSSCDGNNGGDTHKSTDHRSVRKPENKHTHSAQDTEDKGFDTLTDNKASERVIENGKNVEETCSEFHGKIAV